MQRCRTCPSCGTYDYIRVGRNFRLGTWKKCTSCGTVYDPPTSLLVAVFSILASAPAFMLAAFMASSSIEIFLLFGIFATGLMGYGVITVVRYARMPMGPSKKQSRPASRFCRPTRNWIDSGLIQPCCSEMRQCPPEAVHFVDIPFHVSHS